MKNLAKKGTSTDGSSSVHKHAAGAWPPWGFHSTTYDTNEAVPRFLWLVALIRLPNVVVLRVFGFCRIAIGIPKKRLPNFANFRNQMSFNWKPFWTKTNLAHYEKFSQNLHCHLTIINLGLQNHCHKIKNLFLNFENGSKIRKRHSIYNFHDFAWWKFVWHKFQVPILSHNVCVLK